MLGLLLLTGSLALGSATERSLVVDQPALKYVFRGEPWQGDTPGYYFNGTDYVPLGFIFKGTTYVPLRFLAEALDELVFWDGQTKTITVGRGPAATSAEQLVPGQEEADLWRLLGAPNRLDAGEYGQSWWIYNADLKRYTQVGVKAGRMVEIFTMDPGYKFNNVGPGSSVAQLAQAFPFESQVKFNLDRVEVSVKNDSQRQLVLRDGLAYIFYIDQIDQVVSGLRVIYPEQLLNMTLYSAQWNYYGEGPDFSPPQLAPEYQKQVENGYQRQIFDLANAARQKKGLAPLKWHPQAAQAAQGHSRDMLENDFFDHYSATTGGPADRFRALDINYQMMAENIAMGQADAVEAHQAWMNSPGHRTNLLNAEFTYLGTGVAEHYYSQEFLKP